MKYISVCSGIEAASKAWEPIGWEPVAFSEIEPFPATVLKHHWPEVPNLGDMTKYEQWNIPSGSIELLVGGTPCQSFSVAGLRKGLHDPRGGLMLTFLEIAKSLRPRWIVWENVPGVLSSHGGRDFGSFLGALGELGYGWAYRVLDAQWFGVAQRRRRVFVVGCLGDGAAAAKVLFESESVRRDSPPSREKGQRVAADAQEGVGVSGIAGGFRMQSFGEYSEDGTASAMKARDYKDATDLAVLYENHPNDSRVTGPHEVAPACVSRFGTGGGNVPLVQEAVPVNIYGGNKRKDRPNGGFYANVGEATSKTLDSASGLNPACNQGGTAVVQEALVGQVDWRTANSDNGNVSQTLKTDLAHQSGPCIAFQESELRLTGKITEQKVVPTLKAGTKGGDTEPKVVAFEPGIASREGNESRFVKELSPTLRKDMGDNQVAVAVDTYNQTTQEKAVPIRSTASDICHTGGVINPRDKMAVRRLTPKECERLQGFGDNHTLIPWRGKPADQCPDGPRYKALGNSMAVPCMAWIGKRIDKVDRENRKANK